MTVLRRFFEMNSGHQIPAIGLGTFWNRDSDTIFFVVEEALKAGYRSFDTASVYKNEAHIGEALKSLLPKYNLTRGDIFLTSKLAPSDQGGGRETENAVRSSITNLKCDYLDLYLIHWPGAANLPMSSTQNRDLRRGSWETLVRLHKEQLLRSIGVSNYTVRHIEELVADCSGVVPAVNQVEWHPHYNQPDLFDTCKKYGIILQAYSSLGSSSNKSLLTDRTINEVAAKLKKTAAQILLKWALQHGIAIIPKATSVNHIRDNVLLDFEIPAELMRTIDNLNKQEKYAWNPDLVV